VIWVISDTHLTKCHILPDEFARRVDREDIIFHLGDLVAPAVLNELQSLCRVEAVYGNCDLPQLRRSLSTKKIVKINGLKIGLVHGRGSQIQTFEMVKREFGGKVDIALFGHTHLPWQLRENGTLYFNPGSLRDGRGGVNTFGVLHLDDQPYGEIIVV